jgi:hypothetical protein
MAPVVDSDVPSGTHAPNNKPDDDGFEDVAAGYRDGHKCDYDERSREKGITSVGAGNNVRDVNVSRTDSALDSIADDHFAGAAADEAEHHHSSVEWFLHGVLDLVLREKILSSHDQLEKKVVEFKHPNELEVRTGNSSSMLELYNNDGSRISKKNARVFIYFLFILFLPLTNLKKN